MRFLLIVCALLSLFEGIRGQTFHYVNQYARDFTTAQPSLEIPIDLSPYDGFTVEAWILWKTQRSGAVTMNQTLLFYGTDEDYLWITPAKEFQDNPGPNTNPLGFVQVNNEIFEFSTGFVPPPSGRDAEKRWAHVTLSLTKGGQGNVFGWPTSSFTNQDFNFNTPNGKLIFGNVPSNLQDTLNANPLDGTITEIRIWDHSRTATQINEWRFTSLAGNEDGLLRYYRLQETTGNTLVDSTGNQDVPLSGAPPVIVITPTGETTPYLFPELKNARRVSDKSREPITVNAYGPGITYTYTVDPNPNGVLDINGDTENPFTFTGGSMETVFTPSRSTCGRDLSYTLTMEFRDTLKYEFLNLLPLEAPSHQELTTESQLVTFSGNFGPNGALLSSSESVQIEFAGSPPVDCTEPVVSGNSLSCYLDKSTGYNGTLVLDICNDEYRFPGVVSFKPPVITSSRGFNSTVLTIEGQNFGPSRTPTSSDPMDTVLINGTACSFLQISQTNISCTFDFEVGESYPFEVIIGGQSASSTVLFNVCSQPCGGGAVCVAQDVCNCSLEYEPPFCQDRVQCAPECVNGGICIRASGGGTACDCPEGMKGSIDCSDNNVGMIAGIAGGVAGAAVIVAVIIVAVFLLKREKREGKNFIPLEKKDFSKIIYGEQLHQSPEKNSGNLKELEALLVEDMEVAATISEITQITEADKIAKALMIVYQDNGKVLDVLEKFISQEVETTESAGTLFRSNSMVSKMFKFYSRMIGLPYLYVTIGPEISKLIEEELGLEVDPEKMEEGKDLDEMRWALMSQSQKILKQILASDEQCPSQFHRLFGYLKEEIGKRFPNNVNTTIGGFIFLRFFCPAVSSPEAYGIVDEPPSADSRRLLILITKVLQNLSNDVEFGSKEPYMTKMNDFIHSNRGKLVTFYDKITKPSAKEASCVLPKNIKAVSLSVLSLHIRDNLSKITNEEHKDKLKSIVEE